jgi:transcriptional regulator with XRE-family HTH domain
MNAKAAGSRSDTVPYPEYAALLNAAMKRSGMKQSDLTKAAFGVTKDTRGFDVGKGRDRISKYCLGKTKPSNKTLEKLAAVLNVPVDALSPRPVGAPPRPSQEYFISEQIPHTGKYRVKMDYILDSEANAALAQLMDGLARRRRAGDK